MVSSLQYNILRYFWLVLVLCNLFYLDAFFFSRYYVGDYLVDHSPQQVAEGLIQEIYAILLSLRADSEARGLGLLSRRYAQ